MRGSTQHFLLASQGAKPATGFQTARSAFAAELRKTGRQLPLQLKNAQQESEARQSKSATKKGASSASAMFPEGQGAFNSTAAPRQGLLRGKGSKRPDAQGIPMVAFPIHDGLPPVHPTIAAGARAA